MRSIIPKNPAFGTRLLSSVVPGEVTGNNSDRQLTNLDLALKLHYVQGVYFFKSEAVQGMTIQDLKEHMFPWLALYPATSGRIRRSAETGRPFIKCNDGGVRIVEADNCDQTMEEWLAMNDHQYSLDNFLVYDQVLGPDLGFSPLVFIQFTWFKCGGMCVGLSWSHVLGDPFSASTLMNTLGQIMEGHVPAAPLRSPGHNGSKYPSPAPKKPFSLKQVDPVGDCWLTANNCQMETHSLHFTAKQLDNIVPDVCALDQQPKLSHFELLSAIIWKSLSKVRGDSGPRIVTICRRSNPHAGEHHKVPRNDIVFSIVEADFSVAEADISELAQLIAGKQEEENGLIEEMMGSTAGELDCVVYGTNLTFVNLEGANIYGLEFKGHKPVYANYTIKGVGDGGAVLVLPGPPDSGGKQQDAGKVVTLILPINQLTALMNELREDWGIV